MVLLLCFFMCVFFMGVGPAWRQVPRRRCGDCGQFGGAWTPIGDVTTTMLWIHGQISTVKTIQVR